jgi:hypothetical protein
MTKYSLYIIVFACLIVLALPALAAAAPQQGDRVCIYKSENFHGHRQCYRPGEEVSDLKHADLESIRIFGHARAIVYEDRDFGGRKMEFTTDIPDLGHVPMSGSKSWHDHVGSLRVTTDYASNFDRGYERERVIIASPLPPNSPAVDEGVCVYEKPNFEGRYQCWTSSTDISDLSLSDWRDRISSVRIFGHARLVAYKDTDFRGDQIFIDHDVHNLSDVPMRVAGNWNHEIESMEVHVRAE